MAFSRLTFAQGAAQILLLCRQATPTRPCDRRDPPTHAQDRLTYQLRFADWLALVFLISALPRSPDYVPEPKS
jgi:hypothetical protein